MCKKNQAFTLTELLVVVVIIGVLSAVVLPKFSKMLETRKTGEAEELMAAVRNEQEARCALDKNYTKIGTTLSSLSKNDAVQAGSVFSSDFYSYRLEDVGMQAQRKDVDYTLRIPSYADGRICCSGSGCDKLNKDYPDCESLVNQTDFVRASADCAAPAIGEGKNPEPPQCEVPAETTRTQACGCTGTGTKTQTFNPAPDVCAWGTWSACSEEETNCEKCDASHQEGQTFTKSCTCGNATYKWHCGSDTSYKWDDQVVTDCITKPQDETQQCPEGQEGTKTRSYTCSNGMWVAQAWSDTCIEKNCDPTGALKAACEPEKTESGRTFLYTWNPATCECAESCVYEEVRGVCSFQDVTYVSGPRSAYIQKAISQTGLLMCDSIEVSAGDKGNRDSPDCYVATTRYTGYTHGTRSSCNEVNSNTSLRWKTLTASVDISEGVNEYISGTQTIILGFAKYSCGGNTNGRSGGGGSGSRGGNGGRR